MLKQLIIMVLSTSVIFASTLSKDAKGVGLVPIPSDKAALLKLKLPAKTVATPAQNIN